MENFDYQANKNRGAQLISELEEKIERYSRVPHYVLITGERGTGKTTIAGRLHQQSARASREFVNLNCASLTGELLEAELFGYEKGAFTGATAPKAGLFEIASGGTLFLDEIGEIPFALQAKLLKAVEEKRIRRVGSNSERAVDTRIVAATSQNLEQMVADGRFRADLYDRLNILKLETVPLKYQKEKIIELLKESLDKERLIIGRIEKFEISDEALELLEHYEWHGNFRELHNFATRIVVECLDEKIISAEAVRQVLGNRIGHLTIVKSSQPIKPAENIKQHDFRPSTENLLTVTFDTLTDDLDSIYLKAAGNIIQHVLARNDGNLRQTSRDLGATHSTILRIMRKFNSTCEVKHFPCNEVEKPKFALAA